MLSCKDNIKEANMTLKEALTVGNNPTWKAQDVARKNRMASINLEMERIRQQMANLQNRMNALRMEKNKLQHPSLY
jgi:hypothetical protein